ncbi:MAG: alpha/beta hydrolase, partial [Promethearchaeota archaeon]
MDHSLFICCMAISIFSISFSSFAQSGFGTIDVQIINFAGLDNENLVGKVYRPITATSINKAPGILAIHGFNNDKDVYRPSAIELARAGFVVFCIDQNGHGLSDGSFSENWDNPGNSSYLAAWNYLHDKLDYVDNTNLGIMGHSMGALEIYYYLCLLSGSYGITPIAFDGCNAMVLETFGPSYWPYLNNLVVFKNVLHIWAEKEEFQLESNTTLPDWIAEGLGTIDANYNLSGTANFDTTYNLTAGGWADGSMRRHALIPTTHPGLTANTKAISEKVAWFLQALQGKSEAEAWAIANPSGQIWIYSEAFGLLATLFLIMSILPFGVLLMKIKFFKDVNQPIPEKVTIKKKSTWWIFAAINAGVGAVTFLTFTYWLPQSFANISGVVSIIDQALSPLYNIGITSTIAIWLLVATGIGALLFTIWYIATWFKQRSDITF